MSHQTGEPRNSLILFIGLGSVVTLTGVMYALQSYYFYLRDGEQHAKILSRPNPELMEERATEERSLTSYALLDPTKGRVRIPVDRAMGLLAQRGRDGFASIRPVPQPSASAASSSAPAGSIAPVTSAASAMSAASPASSATGANTAPSAAPAPRPIRDPVRH